MRLFRGAATLALVTLSACPILSLSDLESDSPSSCGAMMACIDGWHCGSDGHCHETVAGACSDGDTMSCGTSGGACRSGTMTCASGHFGACMGAVDPAPERCDGIDNDCDSSTDEDIVDGGLCPEQRGVCAGSRVRCSSGAFETTCGASSYGPDYETTETKCDGKDNDCNGATDVGLVKSCPLDAGVCAGTLVACAGGAFPQCTTALYVTHNAQYEAFETKCDGLDNDCDGLIDAWAPQSVSASPGHVSRRPVAATVDSSGSVLVLWEEEQSAGVFSVAARVVHRDGTMTPIVAPATTVMNAASSGGPALAVDGTVAAAVWMESVTLPDAGVLKRVQAATLNPATGRSTLIGEVSLQPTGIVPGEQLAIAVDAASMRVLVAGVQGGSLSYSAYASSLGGNFLYLKQNIVAGVANVQLVPAGGGAFWVTYEVNAGAQVQRAFIDAMGTLVSLPPAVPGRSPSIFPLTSSPPYLAQSLLARDSGGNMARLQGGSCDAGSCSSMADLFTQTFTQVTLLRAATSARNTAANFFAWEEAGSDYHFLLLGRGDGGVQPTPGANPGRRPTPLYTGDVSHGAVVFDTEGSGSGSIPGDEVYLARYCL